MKWAGLMIAGALVLISCVTMGTVTPLHEAARDGNQTMAEQEIDRGANVDAVDPEGRSPLHYACANGDGAIAELLLAAGADPSIQDSQGRTPLHYAASNCYASIAKALIHAGADVSLVDEDGQTALDLAVAIECVDVIDLLEPVMVE